VVTTQKPPDGPTTALGHKIPETRDFLTRNEASDMLSCSHQTLANAERRGDLKPHFAYRPDGRGAEHRVIVYDPHELKKLAVKMRRHLPTHPRDPGELAARAFELFDEGRPEREVVRDLRVPPDMVRELKEKWSGMGGDDLVISPTAKEALERALGSFNSVTELVERVLQHFKS
jgi:hypothetical protein